MSRRAGYNRSSIKSIRTGGVAPSIVKGVLVSLVVSIICIIFLSVISLISDNIFIDRYIKYIMVGVTMISIFIGSAYAAQRVESKGLFIGISIGIIYVLISIAIGIQINHETITLLNLLNKCVAAIAAGALGGLLGVNL